MLESKEQQNSGVTPGNAEHKIYRTDQGWGRRVEWPGHDTTTGVDQSREEMARRLAKANRPYQRVQDPPGSLNQHFAMNVIGGFYP